MNKKFIFLIVGIMLMPLSVLGDAFVPEFESMQVLRCEFEETVYNQDNSVASRNKQFRIFRLDDAYQKIYLQKEPIDKVLYYGNDKIEYNLSEMTDDFMKMSHTTLDRSSGEYISTSEITYDNAMFGFGNRTSKSVGTCKRIN